MKAPQDPSHTHPTEDLSPARLLGWAKKGGLAVLDQGLFSGANFLVNILLARWLPPEEYGAFAVALSVFYLAAGIHTAVLTEPMMVFGAGKYRAHFRRYLGILLWGHWAISAVIAALLALAAFVAARLGSAPMSEALAGLAVASPFLLLLWLTRRAPYVQMQPQWAVVGSAVNFAVGLGGIALLWQQGALSSLSAFLVLAAAAAVASMVLLSRLKPWNAGLLPLLEPSVVKADHRSYGGWAVGTNFLMWIPGNIAYTLLPAWAGLDGTAVVRALLNLLLPAQHAISAASLILLPYLSSMFSRGEHRRGLHAARLIAAMFLTAAGIYALGLLWFRDDILRVLYDHAYDAHADLLFLASGLLVTTALNFVLGATLRALEAPSLVFRSYLFTAAIGIVGGAWLVWAFGTTGAVLSMLVSSTTTSLTMAHHLAHHTGSIRCA